MYPRTFPTVNARNLQGLDVRLPEVFAGARNVVMIAFQRQHQQLVDSWVPWLEHEVQADPGLCFYEIPAIGRLWAPARRFIDGGMAAAIRVPKILQRTLTVYGNVDRLAVPLGITNKSTITVLLVDRNGLVRWHGTGGMNAERAEALSAALSALRNAP